jgi:hypothetical protein
MAILRIPSLWCLGSSLVASMVRTGARVPVATGGEVQHVKVTFESIPIPCTPQVAALIKQVEESAAAMRTIGTNAIELTALSAVSASMRPKTGKPKERAGRERFESTGQEGLVSA